MKQLSRSFVWWPGLDEAVSNFVAKCVPCQLTQNSKPTSKGTSWPWTPKPWYRLHADFAEKDGVKFLLLVDSHSKWLEAFIVSRNTAEHTISKLRTLWSTFGLPVELVTDNGPPFSGGEFANFCVRNGIKHIKTPPYHPSSNGQVERSVQTLKKALTRQGIEDCLGEIKADLLNRTVDKPKNANMQLYVDNFLFRYRNTPHSVTGQTPAEILFKTVPRTRLSMLRPNFHQQGQAHDKFNPSGTVPVSYVEGERVLVKSVRGEKVAWIPGRVLTHKSPVLYLVSVNGFTRLCHQDHLRPTDADVPEHLLRQEEKTPIINKESLPNIEKLAPLPLPSHNKDLPDPTLPPLPKEMNAPVRRSTRIRKQPERWRY